MNHFHEVRGSDFTLTYNGPYQHDRLQVFTQHIFGGTLKVNLQILLFSILLGMISHLQIYERYDHVLGFQMFNKQLRGFFASRLKYEFIPRYFLTVLKIVYFEDISPSGQLWH